MSVSSRLAAAVLFASVCFAPAAEAAPILANSLTCGGDTVAKADSCSVVDLGELMLPASFALGGAFAADEDAALFQFTLATTTFVSAFAESGDGMLDPMLGLFHADTGNIVRYLDTDLGEITDAENDDNPISGGLDALIPTIQLDPGIYILALLQGGNTFSLGANGIDNLAAGFAWDAPGSRPGICGSPDACAFSVGLSAAPAAPAPIPEPGTLTLMALAAGAAAVARRRRLRR
jgi:PEP-CTERM motif